MRILIAHNDYGRPSGEEQAIENTATVLTEHGHEVQWLRKSSAGILHSKQGQIRAFFAGVHSPRAKSEMRRLLTENDFDLLHVQNLYPFLSPAILTEARRHGIPIVMRCPNYRLFCPSGLHLSHGQLCERCVGGKEWWCVLKNCEDNYVKSLGYALRNATARISRSIFDNVTRFVVLSEFQRERFAAGGIPREKLEILHNFIDPPQDTNGEDIGETVAFLGRPAPEKGIELFLQAAAALPDLPFAVAGDTLSMPGIEDRAPPNVRFHGFLSGDALDRFCRNMRIMVAPSNWYEGFPNVITRAMGYAKPVICSRIGALPEINLDGQAGLLHEPNSLDELVERINRLYRSPDLCRQFGRQGRERAINEYSRERFYERLLSIYRGATE